MNKTIAWLKLNEHPDGGVRCFPDGPAYPEVSGYLIPTLIAYGEQKFAERLAQWLVSLQLDNGAFPDMRGNAVIFDTAAIVEGLRHFPRYTEEVERAVEWMDQALNEDNNFYNYRACALIDKKKSFALPEKYRTHYYAYGLEGLAMFGKNIKKALKPYENYNGLLSYYRNGGGLDTCATAQIAILLMENGMKADGLVEAVRGAVRADGSVFDVYQGKALSWTAKFYLDMEALCV